jgi:hypothetical protein
MRNQTQYEKDSVSAKWGIIIFAACLILGMLADNL